MNIANVTIPSWCEVTEYYLENVDDTSFHLTGPADRLEELRELTVRIGLALESFTKVWYVENTRGSEACASVFASGKHSSISYAAASGIPYP